MKEPVIRDITDHDIEQVVALWRSAGVARPWNNPVSDIAFARRDPHSTVLVAARDDVVVATVMVGEDGHRGWVYYVAVSPHSQGSGLGRFVMAAAEEWLVRRGVWKLNLLVRGDNERVKQFYEHLGYADTQSSCFQKVIGLQPS
ncbi:MAG TPA: GNAT family acetyltransferase [Bosea sp. (in: a-proteobacteria)]